MLIRMTRIYLIICMIYIFFYVIYVFNTIRIYLEMLRKAAAHLGFTVGKPVKLLRIFSASEACEISS